MKNFAEGIIRFRWVIFIAVVLLTAIAGYQIRFLEINSDVINSLPDDDPDALLFKQIGNQFGGNSIGMVILETDDIFTQQAISHVRQVTDSIREIEGVLSVTSITNIIDIKGGEDGIEIGKLVDEYNLPETPEELNRLRQRVFSKDLYRGSIVSEDGTAAVVVFTLSENAVVRAVADEVKRKVNQLELPEKIYFAGSPMMVTYIAEMIRTDLIRLLPVAFLLIAFILFLSFRSVGGIVLPLLTALVAIIWTMGLMAGLGYQMSMISNNIPIILLAVGSAYTIHVFNRVNQLRETNIRKAVVKALVFMVVPVSLAAITTMIGFVSFIFGAYLEMIRDFGIFTAAGTFFSALFAIIVAPAIITVFSRLRDGGITYEKRMRKSLLSAKYLRPLHTLLFKHPKYIFTAWTLLIIVGISGIFFIQRSVNIQEYFRKGNSARVADEIMEKKFGGTKPIFVLFKGDMQDPEVLRTMILAEDYMKKSPDIKSCQSVADLIVELNAVLGEGTEIPGEREMIEQLWFLLDGNEIMPRFVNETLDQGIILSKFISPGNDAKKAFAAYMDKFIQEHSTGQCTIQITGMPFVDITMDKSLINSQLVSLSLAIIFVLVIVGLILRSLVNGLYATIPIVVSIIILFGFMGYAGIPLNIGTVLVASVALGIGIDYSIHIISHFDHSLERHQNIEKALDETILISGKAIIINVVSVSAGFLILAFSQMVPLQYFGILIALSMLGSSQGALTLLPVILILVNRNKKF